jgi:hypothetical protein
MTSFSRRAIMREAVANVIAHRLLSAIVVMVGALAPLWAISIGILDTHGISARDQQLTDRGAHVLVVMTTDGSDLPAARCDELNSVSGVLSAGAVIGADRVDAALPDLRRITVLSATPGLPAIYWPGDPPPRDAGLAAGASVAADLGLVAGAVLPVTGDGGPRDLPIASAPGHSPRAQDNDLVLVQVVPPIGRTTECLVEAAPGAARSVEAALVGWFPGGATSIQPYFSVPETGRNPQQEFGSRLSLWLPIAAGVLVALTVLAWWAVRRAEFALYAVMGLRPPGLALMLLTEWTVLCLLPGCIGVANALGAAAGWLDRTVMIEAAALDVWRYLATLTVIPAIGYLALLRMSAFDSLKGR